MALILVGFALIALIDLIPLMRRHSKRGTIAFLLAFIAALALAVLQTKNIQIPTIFTLWEKLIRAIGLGY